jgi:hypothetical protein
LTSEEQGEQEELKSIKLLTYICSLLQKLEPKKSPFQKLGYLLNEKQRLMLSRSSTISQTHPLNGKKFDGKGFCFIVVGIKKNTIY